MKSVVPIIFVLYYNKTWYMHTFTELKEKLISFVVSVVSNNSVYFGLPSVEVLTFDTAAGK